MKFPTAALLCCLALAGTSARGESPLVRAVCKGDLAQLKTLVQQGTDINQGDERGWTLLMWSAFYNQAETTDWLLAMKADPGKGSIQPYRAFQPGTTPLVLAAYNDNLNQVRTLIKGGADLNAVDSIGWTPLHWAIFYGNTATVKELLLLKADPNKASTAPFKAFPTGTTPLLLAAHEGADNTVVDLLRSKADPAKADSLNQKPADFAKHFSFQETVEILEGRRKLQEN